MIVLIDNYDSFTYNLVQYLGELEIDCVVHRNDKITVDEALALNPKGVMLSPGPCDPDQAGICLDMISACSRHDLPLFGVCLGHQAIGQAFGGKVVRASKLMHGKTSDITHNSAGIFKDIPSPVTVTRYHSLTIEPSSMPACLSITAQTDDGVIMGVSHNTKPIHGVQFHPESIATNHGHAMLKNFTDLL